jgi:hypothetical protein
MVAREVGRRDDCKVREAYWLLWKRGRGDSVICTEWFLFHFDCLLSSRWEIKSDLLSTPEMSYFNSYTSAAAPAIDTAFSANFLILSHNLQ